MAREDVAIIQKIKSSFRRWQLRRRGVAQQVTLDTFSSGDRSGIWVVAPEFLDQASVVYSFGVGDNLAWELAMIARFGVTVHAFDPTPPSIAWVARQDLPAGLVFHPVGLADMDGTIRFMPRRPESRFNYRPMTSAEGPSVVKAPVARLATHMHGLGHDQIDVLKMDIEGGEYAALHDLLASRIRVKQLLVEFHHHFDGIGIEATERAVRALSNAGYRIFHISDRGLEISFLLVETVMA